MPRCLAAIEWVLDGMCARWMVGVCILLALALNGCDLNHTMRHVSSTAATPAVGGTYLGVVHNTTVDTRAPIRLVLAQLQAQLTGTLTVGYPLAGGGPLTGTVDGYGHMQFEVQTHDDTGFILEFDGTLASGGSEITGSYVVNAGQEGTWSVQRSD